MTEPKHSPKDALEVARSHGVDVSLLRGRLRLSPTERLRRHQGTLELSLRLREAGEERRVRDRRATRSAE